MSAMPQAPGEEACRKPLSLHGNHEHHRMARRLLGSTSVTALIRALVLSMGLWTTGCLVTDGLDPRVDPPVPENSWPRIVEESVTPTNWVPIVPIANVDCQEVKLIIGKVSDENLTDEIYVRWFVDYDTGGGPFKVPRAQGRIRPSGQAERLGTNYSFVPEEWCKGYHVVKVLVADGPFDQASKDFDVVEGADRGVASYSWAVDTSGCSNGLGQCP